MGYAAMSTRLWYPQLDVYDCIRRLSMLLFDADRPLHLERLYILDFFLANPPLLHKTKMSQSIRSTFRQLSIIRPERAFLTYPASPLLFHKMEPIQKEAVRAMAGKGLLSAEMLKRGSAELTERGRTIFSEVIATLVKVSEHQLVRFLTVDFMTGRDDGLEQLRTSTGLRRAS